MFICIGKKERKKYNFIQGKNTLNFPQFVRTCGKKIILEKSGGGGKREGGYGMVWLTKMEDNKNNFWGHFIPDDVP